jgi:fructosamine-3-kinase
MQEQDVSWQTLRRIVRDWAGAAADLAEVRPLHGGFVNNTVALATHDGERAVLKISPHRVNRDLEREAYQLNLLRSHGLPVPQVHACNVAHLYNPDSYLLMEYVEGVDLAAAKARCSAEQFDHLQMHLAELVLAMHEHSGRQYRRVDPAAESRYVSWPTFYRTVYDPIWREAEESPHLPVKLRRRIARIHDRLERFIGHDDRPRLVHWDLWTGNILAWPDAQGRWWVTALLDPNCKFAHAEAEIAYMELFQTVTPAFLRAYQQTRKLDDDYRRVRKWVYQLYSLINHVRLFGARYVAPLTRTLEKLPDA